MEGCPEQQDREAWGGRGVSMEGRRSKDLGSEDAAAGGSQIQIAIWLGDWHHGEEPVFGWSLTLRGLGNSVWRATPAQSGVASQRSPV